MIKVKLTDELKKVKEDDLSSVVLNDVKLLLSGEYIEDKRILEGLSGPDSQLEIQSKKLSNKINLEKDENFTGLPTYTIEQIEMLAHKYYLKFLPSKMYTGVYSSEVTGKIKVLEGKMGKKFSAYDLRNDFFILAPPSEFKLQKFVKPNVDPVLFYKTTNDSYVCVHKWGNDFSIMRNFIGMRKYNISTYFITSLIIGFLLSTIGLSIFDKSFITWFMGWDHITLSIVIGVFYYLLLELKNYFKLGENGHKYFYSVNGWDTDYKV